ncbi:mitochondrial carrier domain-containing protein [Rhodotorula diobovata]|uniref:Mitochondrial carrier domain-containing protein n=1 Tax=Rhodotorula diobovata TaxID=5288 RepID=A0A5C5G4Q6_9BASI|nr:mitochondrial carrier domain-containing protein [Rhodotorula diobovata]
MKPTTPQDQALSPVNLAIGASVSLFEITTLGQPLEVLKTQAASHRNQTLYQAVRSIYARGGLAGFYQGLVPWAWIESSTTGGILLFTSSAVEHAATQRDIKPGAAGLLGGIVGGAAQAYLAMGVCTRMKTVEITRSKAVAPSLIPGHPPFSSIPSTWQVFRDLYAKEGLRGINKGVNAVALRQATNWGSRIGIARATEQGIKTFHHKKRDQKLSPGEKVLASAVGGALGCWNQPIEVIRVEMQSLAASSTSNPLRPKDLTMASTARYILAVDGWKGLFRGVTPRIGLSVWRTICLVSLGDHVKGVVKKVDAASGPL